MTDPDNPLFDRLILMESMIESGSVNATVDTPGVQELLDSELCQAYGWTWDELQETPWYVRQMFGQIQAMKAAAEAKAAER